MPVPYLREAVHSCDSEPEISETGQRIDRSTNCMNQRRTTVLTLS